MWKDVGMGGHKRITVMTTPPLIRHQEYVRYIHRRYIINKNGFLQGLSTGGDEKEPPNQSQDLTNKGINTKRQAGIDNTGPTLTIKKQNGQK